MQIGLATLLCSSVHTAPDRDLVHCLPLMKQAGVDAIEYNDQSLPRYWIDPLDQCLAVAEAARRCDVDLLSAHNPCADYFPTAPDEPTRRKAIDAHKYMIEVLGRLGVKYFVFHHVGGPADQDPHILEFGHAALEELLPVARRHRVVLLIENFYNFPVERLLPTIERFGDEWLGICVDVGHAHHSHYPVTPAGEIRAAAPYLRSLHIHDNHGHEAGDEHLPPGWGTIDWPSVVTALRDVNYQGPFMMEVMRNDKRLAAHSPEDAIAVVADAARAVLAQQT
ncbi:MAG: sugar phosphate isomerase/epimerase family protein [Armatimonadota bacterium]